MKSKEFGASYRTYNIKSQPQISESVLAQPYSSVGVLTENINQSPVEFMQYFRSVIMEAPPKPRVEPTLPQAPTPAQTGQPPAQAGQPAVWRNTRTGKVSTMPLTGQPPTPAGQAGRVPQQQAFVNQQLARNAQKLRNAARNMAPGSKNVVVPPEEFKNLMAKLDEFKKDLVKAKNQLTPEQNNRVKTEVAEKKPSWIKRNWFWSIVAILYWLHYEMDPENKEKVFQWAGYLYNSSSAIMNFIVSLIPSAPGSAQNNTDTSSNSGNPPANNSAPPGSIPIPQREPSGTRVPADTRRPPPIPGQTPPPTDEDVQNTIRNKLSQQVNDIIAILAA